MACPGRFQSCGEKHPGPQGLALDADKPDAPCASYQGGETDPNFLRALLGFSNQI